MTIYSNKPRFRPLRLIWTEYLFGLLVGFCALFLSFGSAMGLEQALSFDSVVAESVDYVALAEAEKTDSDMPALPVLPIVASSADTEAQVAPNTVGPPIPTIAPINIPTDNTSSGNVTVPPQPVSTSPVVPIISAPTSPVQNNHAPANNRAKIDRAPAIWLQDRDGRMTIPLPNWTIEDIEEMLSSVAKKEVTSPIQPFTIQSINVDGQVIGDIARLKIEYRIHLPDISAGTPIRIPLGLKEGVSILEGEEAQFFDAIKYTGNGLYSIEYNDSLGGYIAVISVGETDANIHTLSLSLSFPVERLSGGEYRLRATFPPALHAKLRLVIPIPDIQIQTGQGIVAMPPITLNETSSEVVLGGLNRSGGPTEIVWFRVGGQTPRQRTGFQVEDAQFDAVVGIRDIQYSVRLPIRIHGGSADLFQIRLPVGTEIVRDSVVATGSGNTIIEVRDIVENQSTRVVDILLTQKVTESLLLQFKARTQLENNDDAGESPLESAKNEWDLGGFELMSAQKQFGRVRIQFSDDINYRVTPIAGVRPQLDSSSDSTENYRFYTQPFSLKVLTYAQAARIRVKPEYHVLVEQGKLELRLFLRYSIHGAKVRQLALNMGDWIVGEVNSNPPIDPNAVYQHPDMGATIIPLVSPIEGVVEMELVAVRDWSAIDGQFDLALPMPVADWIEPSAFVLIPDDNIEVTPRLEMMNRMRPRALRLLAVEHDYPSRQQQPLTFLIESHDGRKTNNAQPATLPGFSGAAVFHSRKVQILSQAEISLLVTDGDQVQHSLFYDVSYEPLTSLSFMVPREIPDSALRFTVDGRRIAGNRILTEDNGNPNSKMVRKTILFTGEPLIGHFVVNLRYSCKYAEIMPQMSNHLILPLIQPIDGQIISNELIVKVAAGILLEYEPPQPPQQPAWKMLEGSPITQGETTTYRFVSSSIQEGIELQAFQEARDVLGSSVVERAWIQSWLVGRTRFDRIAWKIISSQKAIRIELPTQLNRDRLSVLLNNANYLSGTNGNSGSNQSSGNETAETSTIDAAGRLLVPVPAHLKNKPFTLELSYSINQSEDTLIRVANFPRFIDDSVWVRRTYWQLILPAGRHLAGEITGWTPEYFNRIVWTGFFWKQSASMNQEELCEWIGIGSREPIPADTNTYLFSSFDPPTNCRLYLTDRGTLVLVGSGFTLLVGLCLIYFPIFRHRGPILVFIMLYIGLCLWRPSATLMFIQTSVFGLLLTFLALFFVKLSGGKSGKSKNPVAEYRANIPSSPQFTAPKPVIHQSSLWVDEPGR